MRHRISFGEQDFRDAGELRRFRGDGGGAFARNEHMHVAAELLRG